MTPAATAVDVLMPSLADGMESGTIIAWLPDDGATVAAGDELVEIETDKASMTVTAEATGVLQLVAAVGDSVPVGALIARIGSAADTPATSPTAADTSEPPPVPGAAPGPGPTTIDRPRPRCPFRGLPPPAGRNCGPKPASSDSVSSRAPRT